MSKKDDALKKALEAFQYVLKPTKEFDEDVCQQLHDNAITAIREALAEPEPRNQCAETCERAKLCAICATGLEMSHPQPSKPWVGLTDEERDAILNREFKQWWSRHDAVCRAIEAKLKERNT